MLHLQILRLLFIQVIGIISLTSGQLSITTTCDGKHSTDGCASAEFEEIHITSLEAEDLYWSQEVAAADVSLLQQKLQLRHKPNTDHITASTAPEDQMPTAFPPASEPSPLAPPQEEMPTAMPSAVEHAPLAPPQDEMAQVNEKHAAEEAAFLEAEEDLAGKAYNSEHALQAPRQIDLVGQTCSQSSTNFNGACSRAIDGNSNTAYQSNSCTHTNREDNPWWKVELPSTTDIGTVTVTNRADNRGDKINGFSILVDGTACATDQSLDDGETKGIPCDATGSEVKITIPGTQKGGLTICELQVHEKADTCVDSTDWNMKFDPSASHVLNCSEVDSLLQALFGEFLDTEVKRDCGKLRTWLGASTDFVAAAKTNCTRSCGECEAATPAPPAVTRMEHHLTFPAGTSFDEAAYLAHIANATGVSADNVEIVSVKHSVSVEYEFDALMSEEDAINSIADALGVDPEDVKVDITPGPPVVVQARIKAESDNAAGLIAGKAANATAVTEAFAANGVTATASVETAPTRHVDVVTRVTSNGGTHVDAPDEDELEHIANSMGGTIVEKSSHKVQYCTTGKWSACKTCMPIPERTTINHCATCNAGYGLSGTSCEAYECETGENEACHSCQLQHRRTATNHCYTCNSGYVQRETICRAITCGDHEFKCGAGRIKMDDTKELGDPTDELCCEDLTCATGEDNECKECLPQAERKVPNHCKSCNEGYELQGTYCKKPETTTEEIPPVAVDECIEAVPKGAMKIHVKTIADFSSGGFITIINPGTGYHETEQITSVQPDPLSEGTGFLIQTGVNRSNVDIYGQSNRTSSRTVTHGKIGIDHPLEYNYPAESEIDVLKMKAAHIILEEVRAKAEQEYDKKKAAYQAARKKAAEKAKEVLDAKARAARADKAAVEAATLLRVLMDKIAQGEEYDEAELESLKLRKEAADHFATQCNADVGAKEAAAEKAAEERMEAKLEMDAALQVLDHKTSVAKSAEMKAEAEESLEEAKKKWRLAQAEADRLLKESFHAEEAIEEAKKKLNASKVALIRANVSLQLDKAALLQAEASLHQASEAAKQAAAHAAAKAELASKYRADDTFRVIAKPEMCFNANLTDGHNISIGDRLQIWTCDVADNEVFTVRNDDGTIRVRAKPELCLDALNNNLTQGTDIELDECVGGAAQQYHFERDGTVRIKAKPELCFNSHTGGLNNGDVIELWECPADENERWFRDVGRETIQLRAAPDMCLNVNNATTMVSQDRLMLMNCSGRDPMPAEQFVWWDDDTIRVKSKPELCWNAQTGGLNEGDHILVYECTAAENEKYKLFNDGSIRVVSKPTHCVNAKEGYRFADGAPIQLYECDPGRNEAFEYWEDCSELDAGEQFKCGVNDCTEFVWDIETHTCKARAVCASGYATIDCGAGKAVKLDYTDLCVGASCYQTDHERCCETSNRIPWKTLEAAYEAASKKVTDKMAEIVRLERQIEDDKQGIQDAMDAYDQAVQAALQAKQVVADRKSLFDKAKLDFNEKAMMPVPATTRITMKMVQPLDQAFDEEAYKAQIAASSGVDADSVDIESIDYNVKADFTFDEDISGAAARAAIAASLGVDVTTVHIEMKTVDGKLVVTATIEVEDQSAALEMGHQIEHGSDKLKDELEKVGYTGNVEASTPQMELHVHTRITAFSGKAVDPPNDEQIKSISDAMGATVAIKSFGKHLHVVSATQALCANHADSNSWSALMDDHSTDEVDCATLKHILRTINPGPHNSCSPLQTSLGATQEFVDGADENCPKSCGSCMKEFVHACAATVTNCRENMCNEDGDQCGACANGFELNSGVCEAPSENEPTPAPPPSPPAPSLLQMFNEFELDFS